MDNSVPQAMSSPSSMDIDVELTHRVIDPPTQQSPSDGPALPCDDDSNQVSSSAKVSLGLSSVTLPIRSRRTTNIKQIQSPSAAPVLATAPASSFMGTGSLALAFRPIQAAPSAPSRPISNNAKSQRLGFLSLPEELKARTLSFVPAREVASVCRAVCPELRDFIDRHESHIAHLKILREGADLQYRIDILHQMKPSDLFGYVFSFRCWVAQRGLADYMCKSWYKPFHDWVSRDVMKRDESRRAERSRWMDFTRNLMHLQREISTLQARAHAEGSSLDAQPYSKILNKKTKKVRPGDRDQAQYIHLRKLITEQRDSPWLFDYTSPEVEKRGKLQTYPTWHLTDIKYQHWDGSHIVDAFFPKESVGQLPLPRLPDTSFCYYVEEEWCRKLLNTGGMFSPLAKAALLEAVRIF